MNVLLRKQLDEAAGIEVTTIRDLQRLVDKAEYETTRLKDRLKEVESYSHTETSRCNALEKEARSFQGLLHKRDMMVKEEKKRADDADNVLEEMRSGLEAELEVVKKSLYEERTEKTEMKKKHKLVLEDMKNDVAEKVPQIVSIAVEKVENQLALKVEKEVLSVKMRYEQQSERLKREILEIQGDIYINIYIYICT
jgi:hypothetical protein